ncbi:hypothetical protein G210_5914, partial [Candida maltosa Xu316]
GVPPTYNWNEPSFGGFGSLQVDNSKPEFSCFIELTDFLEQNHLPFPKHIYFPFPTDVVFAYRTNPRILQDCVIETDLHLPFGFDADSPDLEQSYLLILISLPLKIRRVAYCEVLHESLHESSAPFTKKLSSAHFYTTCRLDTIFEDDRYQNLVNLNLTFQISHEVTKLIPRSVKTLNCNILCPEFQVDDFGFPSGLKSLNVLLFNYPEQCWACFNDLEHLSNLLFENIKNEKRVPYYNVRFPKSLKSVKSTGLDVEAIKNQCPNLTSFECSIARHAERHGNSFNFPEKLTNLRVGGGTLANIEKYENGSSIKFPKSLQALHLVRDSQNVQFGESETLFSNKEESMLQNLKILSINYFDGFSRLGPLPQSLTQLTINLPSQRMEMLNSDFFDNLKSVTSLQLLRIYCPLGANFDYELPPKLQLLEFINPELSKISLRSKSLKQLNLYQTKFSVVSPENFQVPDSLVELKLHGPSFLSDEGGIQSFAKSSVFPQKLQRLELGCDAMHKIPILPPNLKTLDITCQVARAKQYDFDNLPT